MDQTLKHAHVKLLVYDLLSLTQTPNSTTFSRKGLSLSRTEILGIVTLYDHKPSKFLKFLIDDGTGCVPCVLWLNHFHSSYFSRRNPNDVRLIAGMASHFKSLIKIGAVVRVRGKIGSYRNGIQVTVGDVVVEKDPNVEVLHWLECLKLAKKRYDAVAGSSK